MAYYRNLIQLYLAQNELENCRDVINADFVETKVVVLFFLLHWVQELVLLRVGGAPRVIDPHIKALVYQTECQGLLTVHEPLGPRVQKVML